MPIFTSNPVDRFASYRRAIRIGMSVEEVMDIMNDPIYVGVTENALFLAGNRMYDSTLKSKEMLYLQYTPFSKDADDKYVWFQFHIERIGSVSTLVLKSYG
ncbi:hypothetical protein GGI24_002739, partial [Coemansia furcata]